MSLLLVGILRPIQPWPSFQCAALAGSQSEAEAEVQDTATCMDECRYERPMHCVRKHERAHTVSH